MKRHPIALLSNPCYHSTMNKLKTPQKAKKRIQITLSEKSYKNINRQAEEIGVPLQEFIRHKLLYSNSGNESYTEILVGEDAKQYGEAIEELKNNNSIKAMSIDELIKDLKK